MAESQEKTHHRSATYTLITVAMFLGVGLLCWYIALETRLLTAILQLIPTCLVALVVLVIAHPVHRREASAHTPVYAPLQLLVAIAAVPTAFLLVLYTMYVKQQRGQWQSDWVSLFFSGTAFLSACLVLVLVSYLTFALVKPKRSSGQLAAFVREHKVSAIVIFFAMFLFATYFMAYSIAFHDRGGHPGFARSIEGDVDDGIQREPNCTAAKTSSLSARHPRSGWEYFISSASAQTDFALLGDDLDCAMGKVEQFTFVFYEGEWDLLQSDAFSDESGCSTTKKSLREDSAFDLLLNRDSVATDQTDIKAIKKLIKRWNGLEVCMLRNALKNRSRCGSAVVFKLRAVPTAGNQEQNYTLSGRRINETRAVIFDHLFSVPAANAVFPSFSFEAENENVSTTAAHSDSESDDMDRLVYPRVGVTLRLGKHPTDTIFEIEQKVRELGDSLKTSIFPLTGGYTKDGKTVYQLLNSFQGELRDLKSEIESLGSQVTSASLSGDPQQPIKPEAKPCFRPLLDYIYFLIYTTTTTGYGDLRPACEWSKFVVSIANLTEVFFIVVFFNVLFSAMRDEDSANHASATTAPGEPVSGSSERVR